VEVIWDDLKETDAVSNDDDVDDDGDEKLNELDGQEAVAVAAVEVDDDDDGDNDRLD
jgi:hypothetical protein